MPINIENSVGLAGGSVVGIAVLFKLAKFVMQTLRIEKLESTVVAADVASYKRLLEEITRQGIELAKQRKLINTLYHKMDSLRELELEGFADLGMLTVHVRNMPCGACGSPDDTFADIEIILKRMMDRRLVKQKLFSDMPIEEIQELKDETKI